MVIFFLNFKNLLLLFGILLLFVGINSCSVSKENEKANLRPSTFVDIEEVITDIQLDIRYKGSCNFIGQPVDGYRAAKCLLTQRTANALQKVQTELAVKHLALKIYDCYRPQIAVDEFVRWAKNLHDTRMKKIFYPRVAKEDLFKQGYIASKSSHSRGSAVDLTIVPLARRDQMPSSSGKPCNDNSVDMGTPFDYFDPLSHTENPKITGKSRHNRQLLKTVMEKYGFNNLQEEWWHYTLSNEPYPETYFNFPVE